MFYGSAAMLTQSQGKVYSRYSKGGLLKRGGGPETNAGTWEHVSCSYKEG